MIISKEKIDRVFETAKHQNEVVIGLYKLAIPDFDEREHVKPPEAGEGVNSYICQRCITFDRLNHPGVMAGGAWLNWGFSTNRNLNDWEVRE